MRQPYCRSLSTSTVAVRGALTGRGLASLAAMRAVAWAAAEAWAGPANAVQVMGQWRHHWRLELWLAQVHSKAHLLLLLLLLLRVL